MNSNILKLVVVVAATSLLIGCSDHKKAGNNKNNKVEGKDITAEFLVNYAGTFMDSHYSDEFTISPDGTFTDTLQRAVGYLTVCRYSQSGKIIAVLERSEEEKKQYVGDASYVLKITIEKTELDGSYYSSRGKACKKFEKAMNSEKQLNYSYYAQLLSDDHIRLNGLGRDYFDEIEYLYDIVLEPFRGISKEPDVAEDYVRSNGAYKEVRKEFYQLFGNRFIPGLYRGNSKFFVADIRSINDEDPSSLFVTSSEVSLGEYDTEEDAILVFKTYMGMLKESRELLGGKFVPMLNKGYDRPVWYSKIYLVLGDGAVYTDIFSGGQYDTMKDGISAVRAYMDMLKEFEPLLKEQFIPTLYLQQDSKWRASVFRIVGDEVLLRGNGYVELGEYSTVEEGISAVRAYMDILKEFEPLLKGQFKFIPTLYLQGSKWRASVSHTVGDGYYVNVGLGEYSTVEDGISAVREYMEKKSSEK